MRKAHEDSTLSDAYAEELRLHLTWKTVKLQHNAAALVSKGYNESHS